MGRTCRIVIDDFIIDCYGDLEDNSNFEVLCDYEEDDFVFMDRDPEAQPTWRDIALHIFFTRGVMPVELTAI